MNFNEAKQIVLGKIGYILITGFVCAIIAAGYKYCFSPTVSYKGNFQYTRIVKIANDQETPGSHFEFNYPGVINTNSCLFIQSLSIIKKLLTKHDFYPYL